MQLQINCIFFELSQKYITLFFQLVQQDRHLIKIGIPNELQMSCQLKHRIPLKDIISDLDMM